MDEIKEIGKEILQAVIPVAVFVIIIQLILFEEPLLVIAQFLVGVLFVTLGLGLFLLGVKVGLLPLGEIIGSELPQKGTFVTILLAVLFLGIAITVAEPDVRILAHQIDLVSGGEISKNILINFVALGVGIFMVIAVARVFLGIKIKYILIAGYTIIFVLSLFIPPHYVPISFDAGGVTTGPMTVPFILALGVGLTSVLGGGKSTMSDSFGYVALASIGPVLAVMLLGVIYG